MKLILDTHPLLWFEGGDRPVERCRETAIETEANERFISVASVWEMALKASRGRLERPTSVAEWVSQKPRDGYRLLHVNAADAAAVETLPWHHQDPFDRLLAAQAISHGCALVSRDRQFRRYGVKLVW